MKYAVDKEKLKEKADICAKAGYPELKLLLDCLVPLEEEPLTHNHTALQTMPDCPACVQPKTSGQSFQDWYSRHGCSTQTLWYLQNCLSSLLGADHPDAKAAQEAWLNSDKEEKKEERCTNCYGRGSRINYMVNDPTGCEHCSFTGKEPRKDRLVDAEAADLYCAQWTDCLEKLSIATEALEKIAKMGEDLTTLEHETARTALEKIKECKCGISGCGSTIRKCSPSKIKREKNNPTPNGNCPRCDEPWIIHDCVVKGDGCSLSSPEECKHPKDWMVPTPRGGAKCAGCNPPPSLWAEFEEKLSHAFHNQAGYDEVKSFFKEKILGYLKRVEKHNCPRHQIICMCADEVNQEIAAIKKELT